MWRRSEIFVDDDGDGGDDGGDGGGGGCVGGGGGGGGGDNIDDIPITLGVEVFDGMSIPVSKVTFIQKDFLSKETFVNRHHEAWN